MKSVAPPPGSPKPSILLPSGTSAGGTVNLILSLGNTVDGQVQVLDSPAAADEVTSETSEPLHRVRITELKVCYTLLRMQLLVVASCIPHCREPP